MNSQGLCCYRLRLVGNTLALTVLGGLLATTAAMAVMAPPYVAALALLHAAQSRAKAPSSTSACTKLGKYQRKNLRRRMKRNAHRVSPGGALLVEQQASSSHSASVVPQNAIAMLQAAPVLPQAAPVLPQGAPAIPQAARATPPSTSMLSSVG